MTTIKEWAARNTTPEQRARRERELAAALVRDAQRKAELAKPYTESYARGVAEQQRLVAESLERQQQQKRRQGCDPDAVEVEDTELRCATCDCTNVTLGVRAASDEDGEYHDAEGGWCWDCERFVEIDVADADAERWFEVA